MRTAGGGVDTSNNALVSQGTLLAGEDIPNNRLRVEQYGSYYYSAASGANVVVKASAGFLYGILIGKDVTSAQIEISDHVSDGDGAVKIYLSGNNLATKHGGYVPVNAAFSTGITADLTRQPLITFIYR